MLDSLLAVAFIRAAIAGVLGRLNDVQSLILQMTLIITNQAIGRLPAVGVIMQKIETFQTFFALTQLECVYHRQAVLSLVGCRFRSCNRISRMLSL